MISSLDDLRNNLELVRLERQADLEYYRQKVLLRSLHQRTEDGVTWYPVRLKRDYIGTGERLTLEVERTNHLDQSHAFQSGKSVSVFSNASGKPEKEHVNGVVNFVRDNTMIVTIHGEEFPEWLNDGSLGIDVMFDEMTYKEMEFALREVMKADRDRVAELREILLGNEPVNIRSAAPIDPSNPQFSMLNESQIDAWRKINECADVAFIHGPPGTGKTTTLVHAISLTAKDEGQVLVCAPSNAAVDLLAERLGEMGMNVLRIGHPARVTEQTLSKTLDAKITSHDNYPELKSLRKRMEQTKSAALKFKRNFGYHEKQERRMLLQEAKVLKADADMLEFYIVNDLLNKSDVICCTLIGASHPVLKGRRYKTVFIDEAAQALEAACWIPILRSQRVVFAGDHCQLPPTIKSLDAAKAGLATTLFEKGIARHPKQASLLQVQYRMNENIMVFPSSWFYEGKLVAHESVKHGLLRPYETPFDFVDTAGAGYNEGQDPETLSRFNEEEAALTVRLVEKMVTEIGESDWIQERITLGVITPYRAQVERLQHLVDVSPTLQPILPFISINTVDAFQGQERDVIAISLVRSNSKGEVGFLADIRRTNVAMTRARKKLVMIGDSATLGSHPFYLALIDFVQEKGFYKSCFALA